tara:strand:- start:1563 stop:1712 length:150 start_codon:yes stop_codon:yes gene_type:complete
MRQSNELIYAKILKKGLGFISTKKNGACASSKRTRESLEKRPLADKEKE